MIGTSAPALTPASTPLEPSSFMTTTDQLPWRTSQVSDWRPAPCAEATQKPWLAGGGGRGGPPGGRGGAFKGSGSVWGPPGGGGAPGEGGPGAGGGGAAENRRAAPR